MCDQWPSLSAIESDYILTSECDKKTLKGFAIYFLFPYKTQFSMFQEYF